MMIGRVLALAIGLFTGLAASQGPEFAQQYRQRLGGAIDEMRTVVGRFDGDAQASGLSREEAVSRLASDGDPLVRRQGEAQARHAERLADLERQRRDLAQAGAFERVWLMREADPTLARATYLDFEPAWPATVEGAVTGGAGFLAGWLATLLGARWLGRLAPARWRGRGATRRLRSA
ncbi:MAG: DUF2937 family protein [Methylobacteriaceae bacterium]|nr:DUF2937 family protein [Methylobacteriaceae bacterium]